MDAAQASLAVTRYLVDCLATRTPPHHARVLAEAGCRTQRDQRLVSEVFERRLPEAAAAWAELRQLDRRWARVRARRQQGEEMTQGDLLGELEAG